MRHNFHRYLIFCATLSMAGCGDVNEPTIPFPQIYPTAISGTSVTLTWNQASDTRSDTADLVYKVYQSGANPAYQSFDTIGEVEAGTLVGTVTGAGTLSISTGITAGNAYYFNIVVLDEEDNKALYSPLGEYFHASQISYYPFSGNTNDVTAVPNHLVVAAGLALPVPISDRFIHTSSAYNFTPTTSQCLQSTANVSITPNADRSVSFWVQSSNPAAGATRAVFAWGNDSGNGTSFGFIENGLNSFWTAWLGAINPPTPTAVTSSWEHWVIVSTGGVVSAYKNGSAVAVPMMGATVNTAGSLLYVGCGMVGVALDYFYQGNIDDVRIFSLALGPTDVSNLYTVTQP